MEREEVEVGGCATTVDRYGSGPRVVLLHGERGPRGAKAFIERLAKHFEVHVPRHVGWAGTRRADHVTTARDVALVQQEYVERFGEPVPLIGLSFGAWIAAEIAANAPSLVSRLVLISPIGVKIGGREERDFADIYLLPEPERTAIYHAPAYSPAFSADDEACLEMALADDALVRFGWQPYMHDPGLHARLRRIRARGLVVHGGADRFVLNPHYFREYAALIPGAQYQTLHGLGHRLEEEDPEQAAAVVVDFVSEQNAPAPAMRAEAGMEA
jgi:pimeloyl-ACP methyl ester carboxylesterase